MSGLVRASGVYVVAVLAALGAACPAGALGAGPVQPYGMNDAGGFRNILPPGTNGLVTVSQLAAYELNHNTRPPHNNDQLGMYSRLTTAAPNITAGQVGNYFKDATFGVKPGDVANTESPEKGVVIVRDKQFGVPHIYGQTRAALEFGIGYATAEDRLFFIDALRHAGQGDLASFAGGSNVGMDESVWDSEPYTQQDLVNQVHYGLTHSPYAAEVYTDASNYVDGINAYIAKAKNPLFTASLLPGEYVALGKVPEPFSLEDLVSIAALVGGIFGNGGGDQLNNAVLYEQLEKRFGQEHRNVLGSPTLVTTKRGKTKPAEDHSGFGTLMSFVDPSDPEAPTTVHGHKFPYEVLPAPSGKVRATLAMPDPGSVHFVNHVVAGGPPKLGLASDTTAKQPRRAKTAPIGAGLGPSANAGPGLLAFPPDMSNALLVSAGHSAGSHPVVVMGPQVSYFTPQILMEEDIHGPGIDADGASFPGTNLYVELGHGRNYAWSATSSGQNIIDTFAVPLCNPAGGPVSTQSNFYRLRGQCVQMQTLTRSESWTPNLADSTPPGSISMQTQRTAFGIVIARARIRGRPVAYTNLRSTYMHELDSVAGFYLFNTPSAMRTPQDFFRSADKVGYTFNWFYANSKHIAYFNSGLNPVRAPHTDPLFPTWASDTWRGYHGAAAVSPSSLTERQTPQRAHPQVVDQSYLTSWNNKQAPGYNDAATGQEYASIYRSQLLDNNIKHYLTRGRGRLSLTDLINAMGNAGTQDLRGVEVLPYALRIIGHPRKPALAAAVDKLRAWVASGAHRINRAHPGASGDYQQSDAVRLMDAWWPLSGQGRAPARAGLLAGLADRE